MMLLLVGAGGSTPSLYWLINGTCSDKLEHDPLQGVVQVSCSVLFERCYTG